MSRWKRYLSYFFTIKEYEVESTLSGPLDVCWEYGKLVLNSDRANYSYNHLELVFKTAMVKAEIPERDVRRVLNLGLGGGSTIKLLRQDFKKNPVIRSVEFDPIVIELAKRYFGIEEDKKHSVICEDAIDYVKTLDDHFDLILVDLFIDKQVNPQVLRTSFVSSLLDNLDPDGIIILNTIRHEDSPAFKDEIKRLGIKHALYHSRDNEVYIFFKD